MGCRKLEYYGREALGETTKNLEVVYAKKGMRKKKCINYYPGGSLQPGRSYSSPSYRYGYQGSEKDDEITGSTGTHVTTYFRELDTRLLRWWSIDPVFQPWQSPYGSMDGNPVWHNDPLGNKVKYAKGQKREIRRDQRRLRKTDRAAYDKLMADLDPYQGRKNQDIFLHKRKDASASADGNLHSLQEGYIQGVHPDKLGRGLADDHGPSDHLVYTRLDGAHQGDYSVISTRLISSGLYSFYDEISESTPFRISFSPDVSFEIDKWDIMSTDHLYASVSSMSKFTKDGQYIAKGYLDPHKYDGFTTPSGSVGIRPVFMSKPILMRVDRNFLGRLNFGKAVMHYQLKEFESSEKGKDKFSGTHKVNSKR